MFPGPTCSEKGSENANHRVWCASRSSLFAKPQDSRIEAAQMGPIGVFRPHRSAQFAKKAPPGCKLLPKHTVLRLLRKATRTTTFGDTPSTIICESRVPVNRRRNTPLATIRARACRAWAVLTLPANLDCAVVVRALGGDLLAGLDVVAQSAQLAKERDDLGVVFVEQAHLLDGGYELLRPSVDDV